MQAGLQSESEKWQIVRITMPKRCSSQLLAVRDILIIKALLSLLVHSCSCRHVFDLSLRQVFDCRNSEQGKLNKCGVSLQMSRSALMFCVTPQARLASSLHGVHVLTVGHVSRRFGFSHKARNSSRRALMWP